jgi:hypothetical protein
MLVVVTVLALPPGFWGPGPAASGMAPSGSASEPTEPSAAPGSTLGPVDQALIRLDVRALVRRIPTASACSVQGGVSTGGSDGSSTAWLVTCPHTPGDTTVGFHLIDALREEIIGAGGTVYGESGVGGDAATDYAPVILALRVRADTLTGVARVAVLDPQAPDLRILVSLDLLRLTAEG